MLTTRVMIENVSRRRRLHRRIAVAICAIGIGAGLAGCGTDNGEGTDLADTTRPEAMDCKTIGALITDYTVGLNVEPSAADPDDPSGTTRCVWAEGARSIIIGVRPAETTLDGFEQIRSGEIYGGTTPAYRTIEDDRLKRAHAIAALTVDDDTVNEPEVVASLIQVDVHTPHSKITVVAWNNDMVLEIGTRIAESLAARS